MKTVDVWKEGQFTFLYCVGPEITEDFFCETIMTNDGKYDVSAFDLMRSVFGKMAVVFKVKTIDKIPLGEIEAS